MIFSDRLIMRCFIFRRTEVVPCGEHGSDQSSDLIDDHMWFETVKLAHRRFAAPGTELSKHLCNGTLCTAPLRKFTYQRSWVGGFLRPVNVIQQFIRQAGDHIVLQLVMDHAVFLRDFDDQAAVFELR